MTPEVWVQLGIGALTVVVAYFAARSGARATSLQERAARREEWSSQVEARPARWLG